MMAWYGQSSLPVSLCLTQTLEQFLINERLQVTSDLRQQAVREMSSVRIMCHRVEPEIASAFIAEVLLPRTEAYNRSAAFAFNSNCNATSC
jgi:hypothetical protein